MITQTYGEFWYQTKLDINKLEKLEMMDTSKKNIERMSRKEASRYYNKKLFDYWIGKLDNRVRDEHKKKLLSALMFNNTEAYKTKIGC